MIERNSEIIFTRILGPERAPFDEATRRYPFERTGGATPLPADVRAELRHAYGVAAWNGCGSLTGTREMVAAMAKRLRKELKAFQPVFINNRRMARLESLQKLLRRWGIAKPSWAFSSIRKIRPERARFLYRELLNTLSAHGYQQYRGGIPGWGTPLGDAVPDLLRTIKRECDPAGILASGRYDISSERRES